MNFKKISMLLAATLILVPTLAGCSGKKSESPQSETIQQEVDILQETSDEFPSEQDTLEDTDSVTGIPLNIGVADSVNLQLEDYDGSFFTMKIPQGWALETVGEYENFGFRLYDPTSPERQIFFYGNMKPFLKSEEAKSAWQTYVSTGGFADSQLYADAPVLSPATTEQFFYTFREFTNLAANYGIVHNFPSFENLEIVEQTSQNSPISSIALDDSIIRGLFSQNGIPCEGLFAASVVDSMQSYMYNVDAGYYTVYVITGITAPADEFSQLESTLTESLSSFRFTDAYIQQGVSQNIWETNAAIQVGQTLSQAYDSYNQAWQNRQITYDALSQKRSDATLGYDRLYDTETNEVYRAESGFYDEYNTNRNEYTNPNLQILSDDDYDLYGKEISGYIYR